MDMTVEQAHFPFLSSTADYPDFVGKHLYECSVQKESLANLPPSPTLLNAQVMWWNCTKIILAACASDFCFARLTTEFNC